MSEQFSILTRKKIPGLTQKLVAGILGVTERTVHRWEYLEEAPSKYIPMLAALFKACQKDSMLTSLYPWEIRKLLLHPTSTVPSSRTNPVGRPPSSRIVYPAWNNTMPKDPQGRSFWVWHPGDKRHGQRMQFPPDPIYEGAAWVVEYPAEPKNLFETWCNQNGVPVRKTDKTPDDPYNDDPTPLLNQTITQAIASVRHSDAVLARDAAALAAEKSAAAQALAQQQFDEWAARSTLSDEHKEWMAADRGLTFTPASPKPDDTPTAAPADPDDPAP